MIHSEPVGELSLLYKIGFLQFEPVLLDPAANREKIAILLDAIDADLVVLPELATSGYVFGNRDEVMSVAESAWQGESPDMLADISARKDCSIVMGFPEIDGNRLYNSAILLNPDGSRYIYRKTHLFYEEKLWFEPGNTGFVVYPAKMGVKVGMMICFDWIFPESARSLMLRGADIICHPSNLVLPWCQQAMVTRSLENRVFTITANRTGRECNGERELHFTGMSQVIDPVGERLIQAPGTGDCLMSTCIHTNQAANKQINRHNDLLLDRRPDHYACIFTDKEIQ